MLKSGYFDPTEGNLAPYEIKMLGSDKKFKAANMKHVKEIVYMKFKNLLQVKVMWYGQSYPLWSR